jgi:hypothetical protein
MGRSSVAAQLFAAADRVPFAGPALPRLALRRFGCQCGWHAEARGRLSSRPLARSRAGAICTESRLPRGPRCSVNNPGSELKCHAATCMRIIRTPPTLKYQTAQRARVRSQPIASKDRLNLPLFAHESSRLKSVRNYSALATRRGRHHGRGVTSGQTARTVRSTFPGPGRSVTRWAY